MRYIIIGLFIVSCGKPGGATQFDNLEKVFEAGNWKLMAANDTAYAFFSREGPNLIKVYNYRMMNGDSVKTEVHTIQGSDGKITWDWLNGELEKATENENVWRSGGSEMRFKKRDSLHIDVTADKEKIVMERTLPISTFLVRAKYDFLHGTNTANAPN